MDMKLRFYIMLLGIILFPTLTSAESRNTLPFDTGWLFFKGDTTGAEAVHFDDSKWRRLDVPHDWSIEGPFDVENPTGPGGGFLPAGVGWYRKHFNLPAEYAGQKVFIEFDGIMANSEVWINGKFLGKRPNGYVSFRYDLTGAIHTGKDITNILSVRADNSGQPASRWYTGAGIYRHVRLVVTDPVHFSGWEPFITTPYISKTQATVSARGKISNQLDKPVKAAVEITIISPDGKVAGKAKTEPFEIMAGESINYNKELTILNPALWELDSPDLYRARLAICGEKAVHDNKTVYFGIRDARFDSGTGFWLNENNIKIKGVCLHHDGGAFGAAVPLRVWERRLEKLRKLGVNAIRTAHNPVAPEFLDLCDRMGFLVMDELFDCWTVGKRTYDYHRYFKDWAHKDVRDIVLRDRNHPSIILYSAGNEIRDTVREELAREILSGLVETFHKYDPTRPVTQGLFRPNVSHDYDNGLADLLDVVGTNYRDLELLEAWKDKPSRKIIGTEQRHELATWLNARDYDQHAGQFLWSGIDYLGESFGWPVIAAGFGLLDRTGAVKPMAYERMSWWSEKPVVRIVRRTSPPKSVPTDPGFAPVMHGQTQFADWTPANRQKHEETVEVYSNCEEVELMLNGRSLGKKTHNADDSPRVWKVQWEPGSLSAIGRNKGIAAGKYKLQTAGKPSKVMLTVEKNTLAPAWDDVVFVTAAITDKNGITVPDASDRVSFDISGPGIIAAVDNGDNSDHDPFQASQRRAYQGQCYAVIRALKDSGVITLNASVAGLTGDSVSLKAVPVNRDKR